MNIADARRLERLEPENALLKRMVAVHPLNSQVFKGGPETVLVPEQRRAVVAHAG